MNYKVSSMNILTLFKTAFLGALFFCSGCSGDAMSKADIEKVISENLKQGSQNLQIIDFFESQNWVFGFDRHLNRYQARDPEDDKRPAFLGGHQIYIYVNDEKEFVRAEVEKVYNAL